MPKTSITTTSKNNKVDDNTVNIINSNNYNQNGVGGVYAWKQKEELRERKKKRERERWGKRMVVKARLHTLTNDWEVAERACPIVGLATKTCMR